MMVEQEETAQTDQLLARTRQGDQQALVQLLQLFENELLRTAQAMLNRGLRSLLDPADLLQSTYRTLLEGQERNQFTFHSARELRSLVTRIIKNKIIRHWRHHKCHERFERSHFHAQTQALADTVAAAHGTAPLEVAESTQKLLQDLTGPDRQLVELRLQGYSTAETARILGLHPDFLRVRLSRLRQRLRKTHALEEWI